MPLRSKLTLALVAIAIVLVFPLGIALRSLQRRILAAGPPVGRVGYSIYLFELPQEGNP